jgi:hypothetical protein
MESTDPNRYTAQAKFCFCKNNKRMIIISIGSSKQLFPDPALVRCCPFYKWKRRISCYVQHEERDKSPNRGTNSTGANGEAISGQLLAPRRRTFGGSLCLLLSRDRTIEQVHVCADVRRPLPPPPSPSLTCAPRRLDMRTLVFRLEALELSGL